MLESLAGQGGASGGGPHQEAACAAVGGGPDKVTDPLHAEHAIEGEEGDGADAVVGVGGARGDERAQAARLGDTLFEDLPIGGFLVVEQIGLVDGLVELAGM